MIKLKNILNEVEREIDPHHPEDYPEPENVNQEKKFTTFKPSKPTVHTKPGEAHHPYISQHQMSATKQSAVETGTPYYIHQDYVNILRQVYNNTLFKTKSQHEAERALQSAMKSDYYKDSILKKYHDRIEWERGRPGREKAEQEAIEAFKKAEQEALSSAYDAREKSSSTSNYSDTYRAARDAAFAAQERELRRRNKERHYGWAPGSADYDEVDD